MCFSFTLTPIDLISQESLIKYQLYSISSNFFMPLFVN